MAEISGENSNAKNLLRLAQFWKYLPQSPMPHCTPSRLPNFEHLL